MVISQKVWGKCPDCGCERWLHTSQESYLCRKCSGIRRRGEGHYRWNGGRYDYGEYVKLKSRDFGDFSPMADKKREVYEHRLVMAKSLERCLYPWEIVHHKNGIKGDNRLENLELIGGLDNHSLKHTSHLLAIIKALEERVRELETELTIK